MASCTHVSCDVGQHPPRQHCTCLFLRSAVVTPPVAIRQNHAESRHQSDFWMGSPMVADLYGKHRSLKHMAQPSKAAA